MVGRYGAEVPGKGMEPGERGRQGGSNGVGGRSGDGQGIEDGLRGSRARRGHLGLYGKVIWDAGGGRVLGEFWVIRVLGDVYTDILIHHAFHIHHICISDSAYIVSAHCPLSLNQYRLAYTPGSQASSIMPSPVPDHS